LIDLQFIGTWKESETVRVLRAFERTAETSGRMQDG
jgi:hypothetical protein